jgi:Holliday junction resolvase
VARIETYLRRQPQCWVRKTHGSAYSSGLADLIGCWHGRFFAIEVKRPGEEPTPLQAQALREVRRSGGLAVWCDQFEDFLTFAQEFRQSMQ